YFKLQEMVAWSDLRLDFVVGGVCHCGTNSLRKNLLSHRDVAITIDGEDQWFSRHTRSLPYRSEVESFNRAWTDTGRGGSRPKGLAHPSTFEDSRTRQILSRMPDLRLVFIICDPVGRVEKELWWRHVCHEGRKPEGPCWSSLGAFLAAPEAPQELDKELMGERLQSLLELTGKRMRVLHPWGGPEAGTPGRAPGFCSPQENCRVQAPRTTVQRPGGAAVGSVGQFRVRSC
ncbi:unnamed protein product, partial [Prorocentrum cordatum]